MKENKLKKEKWICSDGQWGGWYVYQCCNCWHSIPDFKIETRKGTVDKRIKRCPRCRVKVEIDDNIEW